MVFSSYLSRILLALVICALSGVAVIAKPAPIKAKATPATKWSAPKAVMSSDDEEDEDVSMEEGEEEDEDDEEEVSFKLNEDEEDEDED